MFGQTRNPSIRGYLRVDRRAGGRRACGWEHLARYGVGLGGSLRIPASFCSVVGLRPTPGMIAREAEISPSGRALVWVLVLVLVRVVRVLVRVRARVRGVRVRVRVHSLHK